MTGNDEFRGEPIRLAIARRKMQSRTARQEHNHPVTVDEFDREHMGVAAKE